ncbi:hypothetical protein KSF73_02275 [Burkholderiaceae bacterium DAT-1]|nr:hypothetical protein [Burkholderiaceae bacterium DAT-1]
MNSHPFKPSKESLFVWFQSLDADAAEFFMERAAIREFDGNCHREEAEALAYLDTVAWLARRQL